MNWRPDYFLAELLEGQRSAALSGYHVRTADANEASQSITRIDRTGLPLRNYVVDSGEERSSFSRYGDLDLLLGLRYWLAGGST